MCLFTCQTCKTTINQRETTTHECAPRADDAVTDAEVEAAAIIIARTVSFDADPDLAGYRALGLNVLTAARRVRAARAARGDEEKRDD